MRLDLTQDLSQLTICATDHECDRILGVQGPGPIPILSLNNPHLLTDQYAWQSLEPGLRDCVFALYAEANRTISYDGIESFWSPSHYPRVWGASIDTLWIAKHMKTSLKGCVSFAEIGTGSGFLTQYALRHALELTQALATDINLTALRCAQDNIGDDPRLQFVLPHPQSDHLGLSGVYDLIVSNPPYIPRPGAANTNPYEGLSLIWRMLHHGRDNLSEHGKMLINISSVAGSEPLEWLRDIEREPIAEWTVPLKVNVVTNAFSQSSKDWLAYLVSRGLLIERDPLETGYRWWHTLRLFEARR